MAHGERQSELAAITWQLRAHLERLRDRGTLRVPAPPAPEPPVAAPQAAAPAAPASSLTLADIRTDLGDCTRCKLHTSRTHIVFGVGDPNAPLMFVGEAPGYHEDQQAEPFVGEAGQLLSKMIEAMGWRREQVYIANILKCHPPNNRNPEPDEVAQCEPFLMKQIAAIGPRMIVALGKFAAATLLGRPGASITAVRGRLTTYQGVLLMPTYHPAYLLRQPSQKRVVWEDLKVVMAELERLGVTPPRQG
jgi:DNA polymerase